MLRFVPAWAAGPGERVLCMAGYGNGLRCAIMLSGVLALAAGACDANRAGGHDVALKQAHAVATPLHRRSESPVVQFVVESSGDLLIHSPVWERALVLGGGRHYNFAPLLARIRPYVRPRTLPCAMSRRQ